ncbi:chain A, 5-methyl-5,6,7,8- tetrahydrofolic acid [Sporocytophaga myxococcoides]|uniref:Chain A, 5-methyl-5,6,7,8-tetrahydrofolic acid n=1 Tax=Sporocytophaga myxococcoides TaxID=153721 RepID=A0A098LH81_9BACT|nr:5,10-methylenetetrahydrofolate reductase [Sporocytophaga myxococcoides]GAL85799.1 chain A, 5-methyl-5,6,7,8- tetrahydrofolic acid [Sporocytophaga myxococcoides]
MLTYGITPPKAKNAEERILEIAEKQVSRIKGLGADALIIYDIQDESDRISDNRPYPFLPTLDPKVYADVYLKELTLPKILFRSVGNYSPELLQAELKEACNNQNYVFVGASSQNQKVQLTLDDAYQLCQNANRNIRLGGIMIPERHQKKNDEHFRVKNKINNGCEFFISQAVYHSEASKNFLSDYYYLFETISEKMRPIIFTLTLCGSPKTLEFLKWLGVSVPKWVENELLNSKYILEKSFDVSYQIYKELHEFAMDKNIPVGFNIESVSINKEEIEASVELFEKVRKDYRIAQPKHSILEDTASF